MKKMYFRILLATVLVAGLNLHCGTSSSLLSSGSSLMNALGGNPNLSTMTSLLKTPGLGKLLGSSIKNPFTLLAPTNDAFASLGADALSNLTKPGNTSQLADLLKKHIIPGKLNPDQLTRSALTTAGGTALNLGGANLGSLISSDKANIIPINKVLP